MNLKLLLLLSGLFMVLTLTFSSAVCTNSLYKGKGVKASTESCYIVDAWDSGRDLVVGDSIEFICQVGDKQYFNSSSKTCSDEGCSGVQVPKDFKYTFLSSGIYNLGDILCWDYNQVNYNGSIQWAWSSSGWTFNNLTIRDCFSDVCSGNLYKKCELGHFTNASLVQGKCNVSCLNLGSSVCNDKSLSVCENYQWSDKGKKLFSCNYGFWDLINDKIRSFLIKSGFGSFSNLQSPIPFEVHS